MPAPVFIGAGTLGATNNNYASGQQASAGKPAGMTQNQTFMLCFAFFDCGATTSGQSMTIDESGWTDLSLDGGAQANSQLFKVWGKVWEGVTAAAPVSFNGGTTGTSGATGIAVILAYNNVDRSAFPGTPQSVLAGIGTALNQTVTNANIASIPGFTPSANNAQVIVFGGKSSPVGGNPTGYAVLTGESLTWNERVDAGSTSAGDAWMVVDDALMPTAGAIAAKTFTATGGTASKAVGRMFALKPSVVPTISRSPTNLLFGAETGGSNPSSQNVSITNIGDAGTTLNWTASDNAAWLTVTASGTAPSTLVASVDITGLAAGNYNATITIAATGATNTPQTVPVALTVTPAPPFSNNAEGGTSGNTVISGAVGNTGGLSGDYFSGGVVDGLNTASFASDQKAHGNLSYKLIQVDGTRFNVSWIWGIPRERLFGRAYCRYSVATSSSGQLLIGFYNGVPSSSNYWVVGIGVEFTSQIICYRSMAPSTTQTFGQGTSIVTNNSWFRLEWDITFSTVLGTVIVKYFANPDSNIPTETINEQIDLRFDTVDRVIFGCGPESITMNNQIVWFDDLNVNLTGFPGPVAGKSSVHPGGGHRDSRRHFLARR